MYSVHDKIRIKTDAYYNHIVIFRFTQTEQLYMSIWYSVHLLLQIRSTLHALVVKCIPGNSEAVQLNKCFSFCWHVTTQWFLYHLIVWYRGPVATYLTHSPAKSVCKMLSPSLTPLHLTLVTHPPSFICAICDTSKVNKKSADKPENLSNYQLCFTSLEGN